MPSPTTITQIAQLARVSRATTSMALRESAKVPVPVRRRVQAVAARLGYRPNPLVSAHMAYVRTTRSFPDGQRLAFVSHLSEQEMDACARMPHRVYLRAAQARAHALGYVLEAHRFAGSGPAVRDLSQTLLRRKISGIILPPFNDRGALAELEFDLQPFATVMIEHAFIEPRLHKVCVDQLATIGRLIQRMLDYGYGRIGIALPDHMDEHANHSWLAGYGTYQEFCSPAQRLPHFITSEWTREKFLAWHERWQPEALITIDPDLVHWLQGAGVKVPQDVACATLSWTDRDPGMSGYYQNWETVGAEAVDQVVAQLFRNERGLPAEQRTLLVDALWKDGTTLPRKNTPGAQSALQVWTR